MERTIDVCLSPDLMHLYSVQDTTVVVVDILRATSCMTTAFAHDIHSIKPFAHLPDCLSQKADGYLTAGERDGKKVDGFDLQDSPFLSSQSTQPKHCHLHCAGILPRPTS